MNTCGRLDEHAKERKSFTKQAYAPGLKGPGPLGRIDFGNPALKPMLRMMADNMKKDTRAYHPPEGLRLRSLSVDNGNGRQIWCFVMEPEGERLLELKVNSPEIRMIPQIRTLNEYLSSSIAEIEQKIARLPNEREIGWEELNELFLSQLI